MPAVVPAPSLGAFGAANDPSWGGTIVLDAWALYEHYGDARLLADNYDAMARWMDMMATAVAATGYIHRGFSFGDWASPGAEANGSPFLNPREGPALTATADLYSGSARPRAHRRDARAPGGRREVRCAGRRARERLQRGVLRSGGERVPDGDRCRISADVEPDAARLRTRASRSGGCCLREPGRRYPQSRRPSRHRRDRHQTAATRAHRAWRRGSGVRDRDTDDLPQLGILDCAGRDEQLGDVVAHGLHPVAEPRLPGNIRRLALPVPGRDSRDIARLCDGPHQADRAGRAESCVRYDRHAARRRRVVVAAKRREASADGHDPGQHAGRDPCPGRVRGCRNRAEPPPRRSRCPTRRVTQSSPWVPASTCSRCADDPKPA